MVQDCMGGHPLDHHGSGQFQPWQVGLSALRGVLSWCHLAFGIQDEGTHTAVHVLRPAEGDGRTGPGGGIAKDVNLPVLHGFGLVD